MKIAIDYKKSFLKLFILILLFCSSSTFVFAQNNLTKQQYIQEMLDQVSRDSLMENIRALEAFGTRYEFSPQRDSAAEMILQRFKSYNVQAESDSFVVRSNLRIRDIDIINNHTAFVYGSFNDTNGLYITKDSGNIWSLSANLQYWFHDIDFINDSIGWGVHHDSILNTVDGGLSWNTVDSISGESIFFIDDSLVIVKDGYKLHISCDGGLLWTLVYPEIGYINKVCANNSSNIWISGYYGTIAYSNDIGKSWTKQTTNTTEAILSIDFIDSLLGWAVGTDLTILSTNNGGNTWISITPPLHPLISGITDVCFFNKNEGVIVDDLGNIWETSDNGSLWNISHDGLGYNIRLSSFENTITAFGSTKLVWKKHPNKWKKHPNKWKKQTDKLPNNPDYSRNIIATIPGINHPEKECIIVAHYDSFWNMSTTDTIAPGADDNASGTSAVMEALRICQNYNFENTIKFLAVSAEELWMIGSKAYAAEAFINNDDIIGVVNGDMLGYPIHGDSISFTIGSYLTRNRLIDSTLVYNQRYNLNYNLTPWIDSSGASDYGPFAKAGYDAIYVSEGTIHEIWGGGNPFYHTVDDISENLNPHLIESCAKMMLATIVELAIPVDNSGYIKPIINEALLYNIYPNPVTENTKISFHIPENSQVSIKLYNILGQESAVILNEESMIKGSHGIEWNSSGINKGMYLCHLMAGKYSVTKRLIIVR